MRCRWIQIVFVAVLFVIFLNQLFADEQHHVEDGWLVGKWELSYDPDGDKKDFIEFKSDGDAISSGELGEVEGLYLVNHESVKAVFTYKEKDFIMTFFYNPQKDELRIVTSHTGRESIYKKISLSQ